MWREPRWETRLIHQTPCITLGMSSSIRRGWQLDGKLTADPNGGLSTDPDFFVEF